MHSLRSAGTHSSRASAGRSDTSEEASSDRGTALFASSLVPDRPTPAHGILRPALECVLPCDAPGSSVIPWFAGAAWSFAIAETAARNVAASCRNCRTFRRSLEKLRSFEWQTSCSPRFDAFRGARRTDRKHHWLCDRGPQETGPGLLESILQDVPDSGTASERLICGDRTAALGRVSRGSCRLPFPARHRCGRSGCRGSESRRQRGSCSSRAGDHLSEIDRMSGRPPDQLQRPGVDERSASSRSPRHVPESKEPPMLPCSCLLSKFRGRLAALPGAESLRCRCASAACRRPRTVSAPAT